MQVQWFVVDAEHILGVMSLPMLSFYESWVKLQPVKADRLELLTAGVVSEFRTALLANPANVIDPDPRKLPQPCVRYAETLAISALCREMDRELSEVERRQVTRAEINLRYFYTGRILMTGPDPASGWPRYRPGPPRRMGAESAADGKRLDG